MGKKNQKTTTNASNKLKANESAGKKNNIVNASANAQTTPPPPPAHKISLSENSSSTLSVGEGKTQAHTPSPHNIPTMHVSKDDGANGKKASNLQSAAVSTSDHANEKEIVRTHNTTTEQLKKSNTSHSSARHEKHNNRSNMSVITTLSTEFAKTVAIPAGLTYALIYAYRRVIIGDPSVRVAVASLLSLENPSDLPVVKDAFMRLIMAAVLSVSFIRFTLRMAYLLYDDGEQGDKHHHHHGHQTPAFVGGEGGRGGERSGGLTHPHTAPQLEHPHRTASTNSLNGGPIPKMAAKRASTSSLATFDHSTSPASRTSPGVPPSLSSQAFGMPRIRKVKDPQILALRGKEYSRLDKDKHCYLDYTGGMLYPESLVRRHAEQLIAGTYGNPHSSNPTSHASTKLCDKARSDVLKFFKADPNEYLCIFTSNASGALRIVGESFPFVEDSQYLLLMDNHNSVNGIREFALSRGAKVTYARTNTSLRIDDDVLEKLLERTHGDDSAPKLFAYPAQSNFSGVKHSLEWVERAQQLGWYTLLDAAAFVPTSPLDLSAIHPDFVSMSFYKMFGYPTGVGCLLMRKRCVEIMQRPWFAGGTIKFVTCAAASEEPSTATAKSKKNKKDSDSSKTSKGPKAKGISPLTDSSSSGASAFAADDEENECEKTNKATLCDDKFTSTSTICMSPTDLTQRSRATFPRDPMHVFAHDHEAFEDGTINYLSLSAISNGLEFMTKLGMENVCGHIQAITSDLIDALSGMVHQNGNPMINILGPSSSYKRGGTVSINVVDLHGQIIPPMVVEKLANEQMISIRSGCFCNPGDSEILFPEAWKAMMELLDEGDPLKAREMGLGIAAAIRISVGIPTSDADLERVINFLLTFKNTLKSQYDHLLVCPLAAH